MGSDTQFPENEMGLLEESWHERFADENAFTTFLNGGRQKR